MSLFARIATLEGLHRAGRRPTFADFALCASGRDDWERFDWSAPIWAELLAAARSKEAHP